jgi:hypothetical protein
MGKVALLLKWAQESPAVSLGTSTSLGEQAQWCIAGKQTGFSA